jgi:hypothetical protein
MTQKTIPIPPGGFTSDEQEVAWLAQVIATRVQEGLVRYRIVVTCNTGNMAELLLLSLKAAGKRAVKAERARLDGR